MLSIDDILGERYRGRRFLRATEIIEIGLAADRSTLTYLCKAGRFPQPLRIGARCLLFSVAEIEEMLRSRASEREPARTARPPHGEVMSLMA